MDIYRSLENLYGNTDAWFRGNEYMEIQGSEVVNMDLYGKMGELFRPFTLISVTITRPTFLNISEYVFPPPLPLPPPHHTLS